jgi:hypothetical protein
MTVPCIRCGVGREVNETRAREGSESGRCADCVTVEAHIVDLCGTMEGHWLHLSAGQPPCNRCLAARRKQDAKRRRRKGIRKRKVAKCATDSGYFRHRRNGEDPCDDCRRAHAVANRHKPRRQAA